MLACPEHKSHQKAPERDASMGTVVSAATLGVSCFEWYQYQSFRKFTVKYVCFKIGKVVGLVARKKNCVVSRK